VSLEVFVAVVRHATIAACIAAVSGAVNELLLGKLVEASFEDCSGTFETGNGGESPAGAALALVLDGADSTFGSPVDGKGRGLNVDVFGGLSREVSGGGVHRVHLSLTKVGELVVAQSVAGAEQRVVVVNELIGRLELLHPGVELSNTGVVLVELSDVLHKAFFVSCG
jgi:hypothetical protein